MLTLKSIKKEINNMDPQITPEDPIYNIQLTMLSALVVGANADKVAKFTKLPRREVRDYAKALTKNRIWRKGKTYCEWLDETDGGVAFMLDSMVVLGLLEKKAG